MKRIGILTYFTDPPYFNDINPGMNLQAYSTFTALNKQYPDAEVEMIRYHSWFAIWRIYLSSMTFNTLCQDFIQLRKYFQFCRYFKLSKRILISKNVKKSLNFIDSLGYDAIYVGSDTVLELFRAKETEITTYWLSSQIKAKKFMIAASARNTSFSNLSEIQKRKLQDSIDSFQILGVRDKATFQLIRNFIPDNDPRLKIIPDPTFCYDIDHSFAQKYAEKKGLFKSGKPIICFHLLKNNLFAFELADQLRKKGYLIVSLRPAKYADFILKDLSPFEFAGIFKYFTFTLTHRFHDSVFCIKNLCPFLLFLPGLQYRNELGNSKQSSLMDSFDLREHNFIEDISTQSAENLLEQIPIAIDAFKKKENDIRKQTLIYKNELLEYINQTAQYL